MVGVTRLGYPSRNSVLPILNEFARYEARCKKMTRAISIDCTSNGHYCTSNGHSNRNIFTKIANAISEEIVLGGSVTDEATKSFLKGMKVLCALPTDLQNRILSYPEFRVPEPSFSTIDELPRDDDRNLELPLFLTLCDVSPTFRKSCFKQLIDSWKLPLTEYMDGSFEIDYQRCNDIDFISRMMSVYHFGNKHHRWICGAKDNCESTIDRYNVGGFTQYSVYTLTDGYRKFHIASCRACAGYGKSGNLNGITEGRRSVKKLRLAIAETEKNTEGSDEKKNRVMTALEQNLKSTKENMSRLNGNRNGNCVFSDALPEGIDIEGWPVKCPGSQHTQLVSLKHVVEKDMSKESEHFDIVEKVMKFDPNAKCCGWCRDNLSARVKTCSGCTTTKTTQQWHRSQKDPSKALCRNCYDKEVVELADKTCSGCDTETASRWYTSKENPSNDLCAKCYQRKRRS